MITEKFNELSQKAKAEPDIIKARDWSILAYEEMLLNCNPTREEFVAAIPGLTLTPGFIWDLILMVPLWNQKNEEQK